MQWRRRKRGTPRQIGKAFPIRGGTGSVAPPIGSRFHVRYRRIQPSNFRERVRKRKEINAAREQIRLLGEPTVVVVEEKQKMLPEEEVIEENSQLAEQEPSNLEYKKETEQITKKQSNLRELRGIFSDAWSRLKEAVSGITTAMSERGNQNEENES